jgi:hypothetical protein
MAMHVIPRFGFKHDPVTSGAIPAFSKCSKILEKFMEHANIVLHVSEASENLLERCRIV